MAGKSQAAAVLSSLNDTLLKEIMSNEELIESIKTSNPDADKPSQNTAATFKLSKNADQCCIEFLKENDVELSNWIEQVESSEKVLKILKLHFTLVSTYNQEWWCQFPAIIENSLFWQGAQQALESDAQSLSKFKFLRRGKERYAKHAHRSLIDNQTESLSVSSYCYQTCFPSVF